MSGKTIFIVGAGASFAAPASLPLFDPLRSAICEWLQIDETAKVKAMGPEVFMHCIRLGLREAPLNEWLASILGVGEPNAVHAVLAQALDEGHRVWSFNVDELIERAPAGGEDQTTAKARRDRWVAHRSKEFRPVDEPPPPPEARLFKPHGSVSLRNFIFRTDQVLYPLPPTWAAQLRAACDKAEVVVIGYRGADIDMRVILDETLRGANSIRWFVHTEDDWDEMTSFLPALQKLEPASRSDNPSRDFLRWASERKLDVYVTDKQRALIEQREKRKIPYPVGNKLLARAYLWERLNEPDDAAAAFAEEVIARGVGHRRKEAAIRYLKLRWYQQARETRQRGTAPMMPRLIRAVDQRLPMAFRKIRAVDQRFPEHRLPLSVGRRLRRAHIMLLSSVYGEHNLAANLAQGADENDPATWIVRAKALRNQGHCDEALAASIAASRLAVPAKATMRGHPDEAAHAVFERVFALIWLGRWDEAERELSTMYDGYDGQAAARWLGWSRYLKGGLKLLQGCPSDAERELRAASDYFASDDDSGRRSLACDVLMRAVKRSEGQPDTSEMSLPPIRLAVIDQLRASIDIEIAEAARMIGDFDLAIPRYQPIARLTAQPMLSTAALIGLAEAGVASASMDAATIAASISEAEQQARQSGFRHLEAAAIITSCRAGQRTVSDALRQLHQFRDVTKRPRSDVDWVRKVVTDQTEYHAIYCVW